MGEVGFPNGPETWDDLRNGGRKIKDKFGNPVGIGLSQEIDSNMALRALLWSFGGAEQDEQGNVVINSKETIEALKFMSALYKETQTAEVFTWDPSSNNRMMLAGQASFVQNAISVTRTAERDNPQIAKKIGLVPALSGPVRRIAAEHVMNCYVIWKFAQNIDGAKQFLIDHGRSVRLRLPGERVLQLPVLPEHGAGPAAAARTDAKADPKGKYACCPACSSGRRTSATRATRRAGIDEVFNTFVLPTMFARVVRDEVTPEQAAETAQGEIERIFAKWARKA